MQSTSEVAEFMQDQAPIVPENPLPQFEAHPFKQIILNSHDRYNDLIKNQGKLGVPTGIHDLDADSGGLKDGTMIVIAGETGMGKSTIAVNFANAALQRKMGVALFTLEMDCDEIADMLVAMNCSVNRNAFNTGYFSAADMNNIVAKTTELSKLPLFIDDSPTLTANQIRKRVLQLKAEQLIRIAIIDYAQIVTPADQKEPREQQVARIARDFRALAKEAKIPVVVLSQLNDDGKLRESRVLAHEAHIVGEVQPSEMGGLQLRIYKGRRIPKKTYPLIFKAEYCRIENPSTAKTETGLNLGGRNGTAIPHD